MSLSEEKLAARRASGRRSYYKHRATRAAAKKAWKIANRDRHARSSLRSHYKCKYGITLEQRDAMLAAQGNVCATCRSPTPRSRSGAWHVDHIHGTKTVRGVLCFTCNAALGSVRDDPILLRTLAVYVEKYNEP